MNESTLSNEIGLSSYNDSVALVHFIDAVLDISISSTISTSVETTAQLLYLLTSYLQDRLPSFVTACRVPAFLFYETTQCLETACLLRAAPAHSHIQAF